VEKWWVTRAGRRLIVIVSALTFAAVGLLWVRITGTGQWGGESCGSESVPYFPGRHLGGTPCIYHPPQWGWLVFCAALGAIFGWALAVAALRLYRLNRRPTGQHP
jgi:hypothetical protein